MTTLLAPDVRTPTREMGRYLEELTSIARMIQVNEISEEEALPIVEACFRLLLWTARKLGDDAAISAVLKTARTRMVPSVQRAWDPWVAQWDIEDPDWPIVWIR